jgi:pimeloyl-ACP methyl ester carboxylesterase
MRKILFTFIALLAILSTTPADAAGHGWGRGGGWGWGGAWIAPALIGGAIAYDLTYPYPYAQPYPVYPQAYPVYQQPYPVYAQPAPVQAPVQLWYYCASVKGYYPYVSNCPEGWQSVPAQPLR